MSKKKKEKNKETKKIRKISKQEKFIAEMCWGNYPVDLDGVRESNIFIENMKIFVSGEWDCLYYYNFKTKK